MGPTASGKTDAAVALYDSMGCELISVDAAQVFRGMNIGTAKPNSDFLCKYPHHLIDIREINQPYSAAEFRADALGLIDEIRSRGKLPVLVGGTMFYYSALENGISDLPASNPEIRAELDAELKSSGLNALYLKLNQVDPELAKKIESNDCQRIQRALEIHEITGDIPSVVMQQSQLPGLSTPPIKLCLFTRDRKHLHQRIEMRFHQMIELGLIEEVEKLTEHYKEPESLASMRSVGYRQVLDYLRGDKDRQQMIDSGVAATRQLAKRQLTWLRNQSNITWFDVSSSNSTETIKHYLSARLQTGFVDDL